MSAFFTRESAAYHPADLLHALPPEVSSGGSICSVRPPLAKPRSPGGAAAPQPPRRTKEIDYATHARYNASTQKITTFRYAGIFSHQK